jgi:putative ABC transport system substrate-binding protein
MRRRTFFAAAAGLGLWPLAVRAQQPKFQVGFLYPGPQSGVASRMGAVVAGMRAGGLSEPEQMMVPRAAEGNMALLAPMAADLVARKVDLIIAVSPIAVRAAQAATTNIPILAGDLESDPVKSGFVASIARPGGNTTGVFLDFPDFSKKWLEVLKEAVPQISNVAVFWDPATGEAQLAAVEAAAKALHLKLLLSEVRGRADLEPAFQSTVRQSAGGLLLLSSPLVGANTKLLAGLAATHRLPAVTLFTDFARDGGLMAYGPNLLTFFRQQGVMAAKLLRGAKPAEMPVETPAKFEFVLNLKTAKLLGLTVPASILLRADEVIE